MSESWLIDKATPPEEAALWDLEGALFAAPTRSVRAALAQNAPHLAVRIQDLIIHDNKKWFGEADIRVDALVVHGNVTEGQPESLYLPQTFRFSRVADGDRLFTGDKGLLVFYGQPLYFLDVFITVSRDSKDSEDLSALLFKQLKAPTIQGALTTLLGLAVAAPQVAAITAALGATVTLADFACQILRQATGKTVGLYRNSYLQYPDGFGVGRHPETGAYREKDLSFWYEIVLAEEPAGP